MKLPSVFKGVARMVANFPPVARWISSTRAKADAQVVANSWTQADEAMKEFYSQFLKEGDLCFDVGANIGNRVKVFLKLGAKVVAVEPQAECAHVLKKWHGQSSLLTVIPKALGEKAGFVELFQSNFHMVSSCSSNFMETTKASGRFAQHRWTRSGQVEVTTLDQLIQERGLPKFVKIDVEGFEVEVLKGLSQPIPYVSFEYTPELMGNAHECLKRLSLLGKYQFNYSNGESMKLVHPEWINEEELRRYLESLGNSLDVWGDVYAALIRHD
jgi:FkbM family methyltransferase